MVWWLCSLLINIYENITILFFMQESGMHVFNFTAALAVLVG